MKRDVTERERLAEEATQLRLRQQQEVLAAVVATQETERRRIAEVLHNGLGQLLYATKLSLDGAGPAAWSRPRASRCACWRKPFAARAPSPSSSRPAFWKILTCALLSKPW